MVCGGVMIGALRWLQEEAEERRGDEAEWDRRRMDSPPSAAAEEDAPGSPVGWPSGEMERHAQ